MTHGPTIEELQSRVRSDLSTASRLRLSLLLLVSIAMGGVLVALWATEPDLPPRAHIAFAVMTMIAGAWIAFALWALTRRRVLLGSHKVVAARMAVTFCALFTGGSLAVGYAAGLERTAYSAAAVGALMLIAALAMLASARREVRRLTERRRQIERELANPR